jgi:hypothetical protein
MIDTILNSLVPFLLLAYILAYFLLGAGVMIFVLIVLGRDIYSRLIYMLASKERK